MTISPDTSKSSEAIKKTDEFWSLLIDENGILILIATFMAGAVVFFLNIEKIRNTRLNNKKLKKEFEEENINKKNLGDLNIKLSKISVNQIVKSKYKKETIESLIYDEFVNHPLFLNHDYQSMPMPLKGGMSMVATNQNGKVKIERILIEETSREITESWSDLCDAYYKATRLEFRKDHTILLSEREQRIAYGCVQELARLASAYFLISLGTNLDEDRKTKIHNMKGNIVRHLFEAQLIVKKNQKAVQDDKNWIGNLSINLDLAISYAHKMMNEYGYN